MITKYLEDENFRKRYMELLISRLTSASVRFEVQQDVSNARNALVYDSNMQAMKYLYHEDFDMIRPDIIQNVAKIINNGSFAEGFRKINILVEGSNVKRSEPSQIHYQIYSLLDNYYKIWDVLDPYSREANFHIMFLRIHPFEDGNGRVARIITAYNFMKTGIAPAIITPEFKEEYNSYIENNDIESMTQLLKRLSQEEELVIESLYNKVTRNDEKRFGM